MLTLRNFTRLSEPLPGERASARGRAGAVRTRRNPRVLKPARQSISPWIPVPRRDDIHKILIIGSGPIVIGQACEFDYSGTQACKALREEGYEVVLVNSNPATIMTDPATADRTYIEPLTWEIVDKVIETERPDALLPTLGGQTGLNLAMDLWRARRAGEVRRRDDRRQRRRDRQGREPRAVQAGDGEDRPRGLPRRDGAQRSRRPARWLDEIGLPAVVRPSFTMGGSGSAIAYNRARVRRAGPPRPRSCRRPRRC